MAIKAIAAVNILKPIKLSKDIVVERVRYNNAFMAFIYDLLKYAEIRQNVSELK